MTSRDDLIESTKQLLDQWSTQALDLMQRRSRRSALEAAALERGTLKFPPATEESIRRLEERLHVQLPTSYRAFLMASGGLAHPGTGGLLLPATDVDRLARRHPDQCQIIEGGGAEYPCDPSSEVGEHAVAGSLSQQAILRSISVSEVASGQFFGLIEGVVEDSRQPVAFAFDFWGLPRLYTSFFDLLSDEKTRSLIALRSAA